MNRTAKLSHYLIIYYLFNYFFIIIILFLLLLFIIIIICSLNEGRRQNEFNMCKNAGTFRHFVMGDKMEIFCPPPFTFLGGGGLENVY